jgi:S-DNA-T family DNA segregation ATPase FtsK/SpoIIIE
MEQIVLLRSPFALRALCVDAPAGRPVAEVLAHVLAAHHRPPPTSQDDDRPGAGHTATGHTTSGTVVPDTGETWGRWVGRATATVLWDPGSAPAPPAAGPRAEVVTGPDSGHILPLPARAWTIARGPSDLPLADPHLSRAPLTVSPNSHGFSVTDETGTPVELANHHGVSRIRVGHSLVLLRAGSTASGGSAPTPPALADWPVLRPVPAPTRAHWLLYLVPALLGVVLALTTGMWWFLLFSLSGPLTAALTGCVERRRHRADCLLAAAEYRRRVREREHDIDRLCHELHELSSTRRAPPGHVELGYGTVAAAHGMTIGESDPHDLPQPLRGHSELLPPAPRRPGIRLDGRWHPLLEQVPVRIDLADGLRVTGPADTVTALVRSLLLQSLADRVLSTPPPPAAAGGHRSEQRAALYVHGERIPDFLAGVDAILCPCTGRAVSCVGAAVAGIHLFLSSTGIDLWRGTGQAGHTETAGPAGGEMWRLECSTDRSLLTGERPGPADWGIVIDGPVDLRLVRPELFAVTWPRWSTGTPAWEQPVELGDVLSGPPGPVPTAAVPIGVGEDGAIALDLFGQGPHALVAGTTGSGKSVFLQTWATALAAALSPEELRLVLVDFKGGAAFAPLAALPHVDSVTSDLSGRLAVRALRAVRAEVTRREAVLAASGASDIDAHNAAVDTADGSGPGHLPRVVLMIDEFQALIDDDPGGVALLESLTALGRSLGIHCVLATQRPAGVVTARMKANINLRIALRVRDPQDSLEVVDCPAAAELDPDRPGLGVIAAGAGVRSFHSAHVDFTRVPGPEMLRIYDLHSGEETSIPLPGTEGHGLWEQLTGPAARTSADRAGAHSIVPPPLPAELPATDPLQLGSVEDPRSPGAEPWCYAGGDLLITGGHGRGRSTALRTFVQAACSSLRAPAIIIADPVPGRGSTRGSDASPGAVHIDPARTDLLEYLVGRLTGARPIGPLVLALDDWEDLLAAPANRGLVERLEHLLTVGVPGSVMGIVAGRRSLSTGPGSSAPHRLIFPTPAPAEAVYYGLQPERFAGPSEPGRGVLLTPDGPESGWDAQIARPADSVHDPTTNAAVMTVNGTQPGTSPTAVLRSLLALESPPEPGAHARPGALLLGTGPLGEAIVWRPDRMGPCLNVRVPPGRVTELGEQLRALGPPVETAGLAGQAGPTARSAGTATGDSPRVMLTAHGWQPPFGSDFMAAAGLGPTLLLWPRGAGDLFVDERRSLPRLHGADGWFVDESRAVPIDLVI